VKRRLLPALLAAGLCLSLAGCGYLPEHWREWLVPTPTPAALSLEEVPPYGGEPWVELEGGAPGFSEADKAAETAFETYSELDSLGRCGPAYANVGPELMPAQERGAIGMIKPSGWHTVRYSFVDGQYLYNRCHLIAYRLTGENDNEKNLITGTRYLNTVGMLPFETRVADYVEETGNHVLYRATPVFQGDDLLCSGVELEGWSVEDGGAGVCFHVYVYNVQPGVVIDYATGESQTEEPVPEATPTGEPAPTPEPPGTPSPEAAPEPVETSGPAPEADYVLNTRSMRFHLPSCAEVETMSPNNRQNYVGSREALLEQGYIPCGTCKP